MQNSSFKKLITSSALAVLFCACSSYNTGDLKNPTINSVAIAQVDNSTDRPELSNLLQENLRAVVQFDGTYKLDQSNRSDCIIFCKIVDYKQSGRGLLYRSKDKNEKDYYNYESALYDFMIAAEFYVIDATTKKIIIDKQTLKGNGKFTIEGDIETGRRAASRAATTDLARKVISGLSNSW